MKELTPEDFLDKYVVLPSDMEITRKQILKAMKEHGKQCWIEGTHAGHRSFKQQMDE